MQVNPDALSNVIESALSSVEGNRRWEKAISRGARLIEEERCLPAADGSLIIFSESGHDYKTTAEDCRTGDEPCPATEKGFPCKHRAAFRLLAMVEEAEEAGETSH